MVCVATAMAFDNHDSRRYLPQSTVKTVGVVLLDEPLAAPLVDGGSSDGELCRNLTCREHATTAQPLVSTCQFVGLTNERDLLQIEGLAFPGAPSVTIVGGQREIAESPEIDQSSIHLSGKGSRGRARAGSR